jgi:hypothetical protein
MRSEEFIGQQAMINRPLVFGNDVPSIMIYHEQIGRMHSFLTSRQVRFETSQFQQNYELIRFPSMTSQDVEELLDEAHPQAFD